MDAIKANLAPLRELKNADKGSVLKLVPQILNPENLFSGLDMGEPGILAQHGDWVIGFDKHPVVLLVPPLPPVPIGIFPIPFIGRLKVPRTHHCLIGGFLKDRRIAYSGINVRGCLAAHIGLLLPGLPLCCVRPGPRRFPSVRLNEKSSHSVTLESKHSINPMKLRPLLCGPVDAMGTCSPGEYHVIPTQKNVTLS